MRCRLQVILFMLILLGMGVLCARADVVINEFAAINSAYTNPLGDTSDWIELYNNSNSTVNLTGWYLTDDATDLTKWTFPATNIGAYGYLLIFAGSSYAASAIGSDLYANFGLSGNGEYLALVRSDFSVAYEYSPEYPAQSDNISYGIGPTNDLRYFDVSTPGATNDAGLLGLVADTKFYPDRGFYTSTFQVSITTETAGAEIYYTTDFSNPALTNGTLYTNVITITNTTVLRAAAFKAGYLSTDIDTHTYIFLDDVLNQPANPAGFPSEWVSSNESIIISGPYAYTGVYVIAADYEMDQTIVTNPAYSGLMTNALLSYPTMSLVTHMDNLFDTNTGIYANPQEEGVAWERSASIEYFNPNNDDEFQLNCGIRSQGMLGRVPNAQRKHAFRLLFKQEYGPTKLKFRLFDDKTAAQEFDTIILRCGSNDAWQEVFYGGQFKSIFIRDEFARRTHMTMGQPAPHSKWVHLYVNGLYWGLYNPVERPSAPFAATYFGGDKDRYDCLNTGEVKSGDINAWNAMIAQSQAGLGTEAAYQKIQGNNPDGTPNPSYTNLLDVENYIDYMIIQLWVGNHDWPNRNWYAVRNRVESTGFKFFVWDAEFVLYLARGLVTADLTDVAIDVAEPYDALKANPEFRLLFADHAHQHLFNGGPLTMDAAISRFTNMAYEIELGIITEAARWGDQHLYEWPHYRAYGVDDWTTERDYIISYYLSQRTPIVIDQFRTAGLYPNIDAPVFNIDGSYQHGGSYTNGSILSMTASNTVYYTLDWTDPREYGTGNTNGILFTTNIPLTQTILVKARSVSSGVWSALSEAVYTLDTESPLRVTEIMYHPRPPQAGTAETNYTTGDFEFIELKNTGGSTIGLAGIEFVDGIRFDFIESANNTLAANDYVVLVRNFNAFTNRYTNWAGINIAGTFHGRFHNPVGTLSDAGENIRLIDGLDRIILNFDYEDDWYPATDGEGYSLTIIDPAGDTNNWDTRLGWRHSATVDGSPGADDSGAVLYLPGTIVINEALTHQDTEPPGDWIELYNASTGTVDITDWYLSDNGNNLTKFRITNAVVLTQGEYVVFTESAHFGTNGAAGTNGFALSEHGEGIYLSAGTGSGLAEPAYREFDDFTAADNDVTFGRYIKTDGNADFTAMANATSNTLNSSPLIGPVVISEILYNPTNGQHEFLELVNISGSPVDLYDQSNPSNTWKVAGISFTFPTNITISNDVVLLVRDTISPAAFRAANSVSNGVQIFNYGGALDNDKDTITVKKPGAPDEIGVPYIDVDLVKYNDSAPWPVEADGYGYSLDRINAMAYGNDSINWTTNGFGGTPGTAGVPTTPRIYIMSTVINVSTPENVMPANQTFVVQNVGVSNLVYTISISNDVNWLDVSPTNGNITVENKEHTITFASAVTNFPVGISNAIIIISSTNAANSPVTLNVNLEVTVPDMTPPGIDIVTSTNSRQIKVVFDEPVEAGTGQNGAELVGNYSVDNGVTLSGAVLSGDIKTVILTTVSDMSQGTNYELTVDNVADRAPIPNPIVTTLTNVFQYVFSNAVPVANAGTNQTVYIQAMVTLDGSGSSDPDTKPFPLTYAWSRISGPSSITINNDNSAMASFTATTVGDYVLQLEVFDGADLDTNNVTVTVLFANTLPYAESFESYFNGFQLAGTNSWYADVPTAAVVVTNDYTNTYGGVLPIEGVHQLVLRVDGLAANRFENTQIYTNVWFDMMVNGGWYPGTPPAEAPETQIAFYVSTNGNLVVWHFDSVGGSNTWTELMETDIGSNEWFRLTVEADYARVPDGFRIYTNGVGVTNTSEWFDSANTSNSYFKEIEVEGKADIDDLVVADYDVLSALVMWLRQYYPATNDYGGAAVSDTDTDEMTAEGEYIAGTDPTDGNSIFKLVEIDEGGSGHTIYWKSVTGRNYSVHKSTNLPENGWVELTNAFSGDPSGTNLFFDGSNSNNAAFYRLTTQLP